MTAISCHGNVTVAALAAALAEPVATLGARVPSTWTVLTCRRSRSLRTFAPHFGHVAIVAWGTFDSNVRSDEKPLGGPKAPCIPPGGTAKYRAPLPRSGPPMAVREWLETFRDDVVTIDAPVSRELEVTRHLLGNPRAPVHFRDLDGYEGVGGLWASRARIARAMTIPEEGLLDAVGESQRHPEDVRLVDHADFSANESTDFDLRDSPVPKFYPKDAGRYITAGVWVAEWEGKRNLSFHRILLLDARPGAGGGSGAEGGRLHRPRPLAADRRRHERGVRRR